MRNVLQSITVLFVVASSLSAQTPTVAAPPPAPATRSADDIARRTVETLAGPAWEKARYFAFTFNVVRNGATVTAYPQRWDRVTGDYRVSGRDPNGIPFLIIMNVNTKKGRAWRDDEEVANPADYLEIGYRRFINDTYWLLMPVKSMDPGVHREWVGERADSCGVRWDVVKLTFDPGVALGPEDQYWMWVNRDTGLVDEWDMKLTGTRPEDSAQRVYFHDFRRVGGLLLSTRREIRDKNQEFRFDEL
ncbi:MAG: hypothetical protein ACXVH7_09225, partial [Thermoanaerobaculia bacterium]